MKDDLHNKLKNCNDTVTITVDEFISVYGNDKTRHGERRAGLLAKVYNLSVEKQDNNYVFTKK